MAIATKTAAGKPQATSTTSNPAGQVEGQVAGGELKDGATETPVAAKPKRKKLVRAVYSGVAGDLNETEVDGKKQVVKLLTGIPTDYDPKKHLPPTRKSFEDTAIFFDWRAGLAKASAVRFEKLAVQEREMGDVGTRAEKKRLLSLTEKIGDIKKNLLANGVSEEQILKLLASVTAAPVADAAPAK